MRFQKSIRIAPGIRINLSKSGVGVSVGPRGMKVGVDGKGRRYTSVGVPGTGISQRTYAKPGENGHTPEEYQRALGAGVLIGLGIVFVLIIVAMVSQH
jgi:hypothetical protein